LCYNNETVGDIEKGAAKLVWNVSAYKMFYKQLISYFVILLVPIVILGSLIFVYFIGIIKGDVLSSNLNKLDHTRSMIDNQIMQLGTISTQLSIKSSKSYYFEDEPLKAVETIGELRNYASTNKFIADILLYYRGDQYIYSSTSSYALPFMLSKIYRYEQLDKASFEKTLNSVTSPSVRPMEQIHLDTIGSTKRFVTFLYPLSNDGFQFTRTVLFLIPETSFLDLLKDSTKDYSGNTAIIDDKGQIIASLKDDSYLHSDSFKQLLNVTESTMNQTIMLDNKSFLFSYVKSADTGWKYIALVPADQIMKRVTTLKLVFIYLLVFIIVISSAIIFLMMRINYQPIYRLMRYTDSLWKGTRNSNELDHVRNTLEFLNNQNDVLNARLEYHSFAVRDYFLFQLLKGSLPSNDEIEKRSQNVGINLTDSVYRVVTFQFSREVKKIPGSEHSLLEAVGRMLPDPIRGYYRDQTDLGRLIMILAYPDTEIDHIEEVLLQTKQELEALYDNTVTLGIGNEYLEPVMIPKSYIESMAAIDYRLLKGAGKLIYYHEIAIDPIALNGYTNRDPEKLKLFIKQGNTDQINVFLEEVVHYIKSGSTSVFIARMVCYEILSTVLRTFDEINKQYAHDKLKYPDAFGLTEFETIDELAEIVRRLSEDINQYLKRQVEHRELDLIDKIIAYVRENYIDPDFSIQQLAQHFNMSQAKISQYYKERTGKNIIDFETELKMERAKQLLRSSKLPLRDVALDVGYYNVTSFIRRFKQMEALTPGEYRKLHESDRPDE
jgi:two-component system response regulator YesN